MYTILMWKRNIKLSVIVVLEMDDFVIDITSLFYWWQWYRSDAFIACLNRFFTVDMDTGPGFQ